MNNNYDKGLLIGGGVALVAAIVSWVTSFDVAMSVGLTITSLILLTGAAR